MSKNAMRKDFFMEIKKTANRFFSIFLIVALGVAFFSGIRAAKPDMQVSADQFFDAYHLMDIRIIGTYGLTKEDIEELSKIEGVALAKGTYSYDVLHYTNDKRSVLKLMAISDDINAISLKEGRFPQENNECIIDQSLTSENVYRIGDRITVQSGNDDSLDESIKNDTFTVVGIGTSPYYLSLERDSSQIGNGSVSGFVMIPEENFCMDYYTEADVLVEGAQNVTSFQSAYKDTVEPVVDRIEAIEDERCEARYASIQEEADKEIEKATKKYEDAKSETEDKLKKAEDKIQDGKKEIADKKIEIADAKKQLVSARNKIEDAKAEYEKGIKAYNTGVEQLKDAKAEWSASDTTLSEKEAVLKDTKKTLDAEAEKLKTASEQLSQKKAQLEQSKPLISAEQYETAAAEIAAYEKEQKAGEEKLKEYQLQYEEGYKQANEGRTQLTNAQNVLVENEAKLKTSEKSLKAAQQKIADGEKKIEDNQKKIEDADQKIKDAEEKLDDSDEKYQKASKKAEKKLNNAKDKIDKAKSKIGDIETPEWYVLDRDKMQAIAEYGANADRIGAIGKVFPVIFFLVAALICLTTMTRMVEEQRIQIGTMKALGYRKASISAKYLLYAALASVFGGIVGAIIGQQVLPYVIVEAYRIMYVSLEVTKTPFHLGLAVSSILAVSACTILATYFSCIKELNETSAQLMRPKAPKAGKRVLLERMQFIWKHLKFSQKASIRNLFRYKKRLLMTVIGIAGCMALLLVGFGVRDSIYSIADNQYKKLFTYSGSISLKNDISEKKMNQLTTFLEQSDEIKTYEEIYEASISVIAGNKEKDALMIVPEEETQFSNYVNLRNRRTGENYQISDAQSGIIISEKLASLLDIKVGQNIEIKVGDDKPVEVAVQAICENYARHYVYMTKDTYEHLFDTDWSENLLYYIGRNTSNQETFGEQVLEYDAASEITFLSEMSESVEDMLESLNIVVWVLIISAGLLAFVVLYNLNYININERKRELATLKVLGFYNQEVANYVYRENIILTIIGIIAGVLFGILLHRYVIITAEIDVLMFGRQISLLSYALSAGLTMMFSLMINGVMYFKLKKIDMVESLKSME